MNKTISIIATIALSFALFFAYTNSATVFAQNQSTSTSSAAGNDTSLLNQTGQSGQQSNQSGGGPLGSIGETVGKLFGGK